MNSKIGQLLLWAGFLSGSLATVFATTTWSRLDFTVKDNPFVTIVNLTEDEQKKLNDGGTQPVLTQLPMPADARLIKIGDKEVKTLDDLKVELEFPLTVTYREMTELKSEAPVEDVKPIRTWPGPDKELKIEVSDRKNALELIGNQIKAKVESQLIVDKIKEDSSAWEAGLRNGTVITGLGEKSTSTASKFDKGLGGIESDKVDIRYLSNGSETTASVGIDSPWGTVNWLWYGLSALCCIVGIVVLRNGKKADAGQSEKTQTNLKQIKGNLADLVANTEKLNDEIKDYSPRQILTFIEDVLADDFREFADGRDSITAEHGLQVFAQVMTQFAAGERSINRAWSASADGYVEEAATCVTRGLDMLKTAQKMLDAAAA